MEVFISICVGLGLAACCGFRIFVPLLVTNIAYLSGFSVMGQGYEWLNTWLAFWILASATLVELLAYYVPFVDNFLDGIATPISFIAGTIIMTSLLKDADPALRWALGLMIGGGTASAVQAGTSVLRLASSATTAGFGNPILATIENILAIIFSFLSILFPLIIALLVLLFLVFVLKKKRAKAGL